MNNHQTLVATDANLAELAFWDRDDVHEVLAELRRNSPVFWSEHSDSGKGFWSVLRFEDILAVSRDTETFTNQKGIRLTHDEGRGLVRGGTGTILEMDPPKHQAHRAPLTPRFTPRWVNGQLETIREEARRIVADIAGEGEIDFVASVAARLPIAVIASILGVPMEDVPYLEELANKSMGDGDPEVGGSPELGSMAAQELKKYGRSLAGQRRANPGTDLISHMAEVEVEGEQLSIQQIGDIFSVLFIGGTETTRNCIAQGLLAFTQHPEQRELYLSNPEGFRLSAGHEIVRWTTPFMNMRRTVTKDAVFGGVQMKAGDKVAMWYASANRDGEIFPDPLAFDINRRPGTHQAFGAGGPHFCLGSNFALAEIGILFEELFAKLPDIVASDPVRLHSNQFNGLKSLKATFTPVPAANPNQPAV